MKASQTFRIEVPEAVIANTARSAPNALRWPAGGALGSGRGPGLPSR
eukprot:CAMPEP_0176122826 /NCGR_PEP_ID=MMETSP0120_2-20121206/61870_1 /TAXON_ID=160619 /ORGANISM="Kryptoperidinium foliaceum, Strain CCMP 1326" /LENGTH=46 /DNA_ID= /DNA_START= /DNA_END= /DNA_ORIENTATION=